MHARVVRFTDATPERIAELAARMKSGPASGVEPTGMELFFDQEQGTAVAVVYFETEQKMRDASAVFDQVDSSETPGTRASIDLCEIKAQVRT
jgi:hypothetical protein